MSSVSAGLTVIAQKEVAPEEGQRALMDPINTQDINLIHMRLIGRSKMQFMMVHTCLPTAKCKTVCMVI